MGLEFLLWYLIMGTAVAGGGLSLAAFRARETGPAGNRTAGRLYMLSYILMSVSMALLALRALLQ